MMTSLYPSTTGIYFLNPDLSESPVATKNTLLPKRFQDEGYYVTGAGKLFHGGQDKKYLPNWAGSFGGFGPYPKKKLSTFPGHPLWDWGVFPETDNLMPDYKIAAWGVEQLAKQQDKPLFLATGFYTPHVPQYAPQKWFDLYPLETLQLPKVVANDLKDISEYAVNTYVVLYTDHGFHQGEKERFAKRSLWEDGTRTPMIIAGPGIVEGSVCSKPAQLLDIYPTLLELTGLKADAKLEGNSLVPLLKNPQADWPHRARTSFGPGNYSIVSEAYRYICYNDGSEEFYDRSKDTHEWNNVITNPEYAAVIKKHQAQVPQQRHEILSQNSTGHKSFEASEAVSRGEPIPADKPVKKNRKK
jgi:arylsulfatase A-like enzyme